MEEKTTKKRVVRVEGATETSTESNNLRESASTTQFVATKEAKDKALQLRIFAGLAWLVAIASEIFAIFKLRKPPISMGWLIGLIIVSLIFAIVGSLLWKQANRLDPASEKDKVKFFVQNQLGLIISVLAFLPLVILIFTNKDLEGKQKGIVGSIAIVALLIAGYVGIDFNPASIEQYTEQIKEVEQLNNGKNFVYWTKHGTKYHLYDDCQHINTDKTEEILEGTVQQARELKNITELCETCKKRRLKEIEQQKTAAVFIYQ